MTLTSNPPVLAGAKHSQERPRSSPEQLCVLYMIAVNNGTSIMRVLFCKKGQGSSEREDVCERERERRKKEEEEGKKEREKEDRRLGGGYPG